MTRAKDISKIVTDADLSGTLDVAGAVTVDGNLNLVGSTSQNIALERSGVSKIEIGASTAGVGNYINATTNDLFIKRTASFLKVLGIDNSTGDISFYEDTGATPKFFWDASAERLGIGESTPDRVLHVKHASDNIVAKFESEDTEATIELVDTTGSAQIASRNDLRFFVNGGATRAVDIDSSGNLLVGKTSATASDVGVMIQPYRVYITRNNDAPLILRRNSSDGIITQFLKDGDVIGQIGSIVASSASRLYLGNSETNLVFNNGVPEIYPANSNGSKRDNAVDLGNATARFDDIRATNGTIQTSDQNEKNTITDSDLGIDFIKRLTPKSYIFNGKTRTHYGLIAQDVETVLTDINKPTSGFAGFIKDDISEEQDGSEYRYGLRYTEFVAPLIQAVKDQQATIDALTARITALENGE